MSEKFKNLYKELLSTKLPDGRNIFNRMNAFDLCVTSYCKGCKYDEQSNRLMIYGQAVNGWQNGEHITIDDLLEETLDHTDDSAEMRMMADCRGWHGKVDGNDTSYFYKRSKFWKLNYQVITSATDASFEKFYIPYTSENDYSQQLDNAWSQKIVWSNLYKIAFSKGGNPDDEIIKSINDISRKIVLQEIAELKPDHVLFNTGENLFSRMFLECDWEGKEKLALQKNSGSVNIRYVGTYEFEPGHTCKVVVCRRPDEWAACYKNTDIVAGAMEIVNCFNCNGTMV